MRTPNTLLQRLTRATVPPPVRCGTLARVSGLTLQAGGLSAPIGARCELQARDGSTVEAEVVGFQGDLLTLMPLGEPQGLAPGARVSLMGTDSRVGVGEALRGRVIDGSGRPLDGGLPPAVDAWVPLNGEPPNPMTRAPIDEVLETGVKAIDAALTLGHGQRIGLVAGSGVGKSMLLGMLTRYTAADIIVIGLVGERGREVQSFIQQVLGAEGLARAIVVAAPANVSPVLRLHAAKRAHSIAEHFRDQGQRVLLLLDSLTRVAHAQREIGLAAGEPPTSKGYPPSVFALLPNLIERGGPGAAQAGRAAGSITALYTVLAEGDDAQDPIVDIARASLDGQVMLSRTLADQAHYPAIDLQGSVSRLLQELVDADGLAQAQRLRRWWSLVQANADMIQVGAIQAGANPELDEAMRRIGRLREFLRQDFRQHVPLTETRRRMRELCS